MKAVLTTKNFFAKKESKFCTVTTSKLTGNLSLKNVSIEIEIKMILGIEGIEKGLTWVAARRRSELELTSGRSHLEDTGQNRSQLRETNVEDIISPSHTHT